MNKKVLIMGGNGFIGSNIAEYLFKKGYEVVIYDISYRDNGYKNYIGNILTDDNLDKIIGQFDNIIYLITSVSPKKSMDFPMESYTQDIPMLYRVLEACKNSGTGKKVIFSSSGGTVYGESLGKELREDYVIEEPISNYGISKLTSEKMLLLYNRLFGMNNVILRISNPFGKGQNPASGVGVITTFADCIINGKTITLYGSGDTIRDFIDVEFVAESFYKALEYQKENDVTPVFNVGSGIGLSLKEIINIISSALNIEPNIKYIESRPFDVKKNVLNMEKSSKYLGLEAHTRESIENSIEYYVKSLNVKKRSQ